MSQNVACPRDWITKHKCTRMTGGCCRSCAHYLQIRGITDTSYIKNAGTVSDIAFIELLFKDSPLGSTCSLDTNASDFNIFTLGINTTSETPITQTFLYSGSCTLENSQIKAVFDKLARIFAPKLSALDEQDNLISTYTLLVGYLHLLCSAVLAPEEVCTKQDGSYTVNKYNVYNLAAHIKILLVQRIQPLFHEVLAAARVQDPSGERPNFTKHAYTAAALLCCDLEYFKNNVKSCGGADYGSTDLREFLCKWFGSVHDELMDWICIGCGRYPFWRQSTVSGNLKKSRAPGIIFSLHPFLEINHISEPQDTNGLHFNGIDCGGYMSNELGTLNSAEHQLLSNSPLQDGDYDSFQGHAACILAGTTPSDESVEMSMNVESYIDALNVDLNSNEYMTNQDSLAYWPQWPGLGNAYTFDGA